jgi:cyclophilin family peptidyl-prolyl cis-trans isomerase
MTPKTLPDSDELKRNLLEKFEEKRKLIIGVGILILVGIVGIVLFVSLGEKAREDEWYQLLNARTAIAVSGRLPELAERGSDDFRANALLQLAEGSILNQKYDEAIEALTKIEEQLGHTFVARLPSPDKRKTLVRHLKERVLADREWKKNHGYATPEVSADRVALVETSKGAFWIGFYPEYSPNHVDNFIAKAKAGEFNGTQVYGVTHSRIHLGGANSKDEDPANDNRDPAGSTWLSPEKGRYQIEHVRGAVSSVTTDDGESESRVTIALSDAGDLNKRQTVFGAVLKDRHPGLADLDEIRNVKTYGTSDDPLHRSEKFFEISDHPTEPITVLRVSIWSGDQIEDGHSWDTAGVKAPKEEDAKEPVKETGENAEENPEDTPEKDPEETKPEGE